jgi:ribosome-associated protein
MPKTRSKAPSRTAKTARKAEPRAPAAGKARKQAGGRAGAKASAKLVAGTKKKVAKKSAAKAPAGLNGSAARAHDGHSRQATPAKRRKGARRSLASVVQSALEDMKAQEVSCLDVRHLTSVTDTMFVAAGRSDRHVRAVADAVLERAKAAGYSPIGVEGQEAGEWVLVDLADVVVHVMQPRVRDFYKLESLWDINARDEAVER